MMSTTKKTFLGLIVLAALAVFPISSLSAGQIEKVTIAYNMGNPPLKFQNEQGEADGILIDIWRLWGQKTGVEIEFKEALFSDTLEMVKSGKADIHAGLFYTKERDEFLDYSEPIIDINYYAYSHESVTGVEQLKDMRPFRIGAPKGYTEIFIRESLPGASIVVYDNFPALYRSALANEIRVFISPSINLEYYLLQNNLTNPFRYNPAKPAYTRVYLGAVQEGNHELMEAVNRGMKQITEKERVDIERIWLKRTRVEDENEMYIIACDSDYAPLTMLNARGEPDGLFVDIWKTWAANEGVQVEFLFDNREGSIQAVKEGLADFHSGFESDEEWAAMSSPFYYLKAKLFYPIEKGFRSITDMTGRRVASIDPYYAEVLTQANPAIEVVPITDYADLFNKLSQGEMEGFIDDELAIEDLLLRQGRQGEFGTLDDFSYLSPISAVTRHNNSLLLERINLGLDAISIDEYKKLEKEWLNKPESAYYHTLAKKLPLTEEEKAWLETHPVIRIGVDADYAPYAFIDKQGRFQGVASDYAELISQMLAIRMEMVPGLSWPEILEGAQAKTLDVITTAAKRPEREAYLTFTQGYIPTPLVIMSRHDNGRIQNRDDLASKTVALVKSYSSSERVIEEFPSINAYFVDTPLEGLQAVSIGHADAYVGVLGINVYQSNQHGITNLKIAAPFDMETNYQRYGVRKDWPELASILDKALDAIPEEQKLGILNKWIPIGTEEILPKAIEFTEEEMAFIREHPVIRLGTDPEFAPFEYIAEDGTYSGITSDYIKLLNKRLGLNMKVIPDLTWGEAVGKAKIREIDVLPCVGITEERKEFLNYSTPYINFHRVIITRTDTPFLAGLEDISSLKVAVQVNTSHEGYLKDNTDIKPDLYKTLQEALLAISDGKSDAFIGNIASSTYWIRKLNLTNLKVAGPVSQEMQSLHFAIRKDWPELVSIINKGLASITPEEKTTIRKRWVAVEYRPGIDPKTVWEYILKITGVAFLVLVVFAIWNYSLKREVNRRRKAEKELHKAHDELEDRVEERTSELAQANELLKDEIAERRKAKEELEKHRSQLEEMVKERTGELEEKNRELERFNKLFVDREFRIKELSEKVKKLEKEKA